MTTLEQHLAFFSGKDIPGQEMVVHEALSTGVLPRSAHHLIENPPQIDTHTLVAQQFIAYLKSVTPKELGGTGAQFSRVSELEHPDPTTEKVAWVGQIDVAKRLVNEGRFNALAGRYQPFGKFWYEAMENPALADHAYAHSRRFEESFERALLSIPELRGIKDILKWIPAALIAIRDHDLDQVFSLHRNEIEHRREVKDASQLAFGEHAELNVKHGHDFGGALYPLLTRDLLMVKGFVDVEQADETSRAASYLILGHHNPDTYTQALTGMETPSEDTAILYAQFQSGSVDRGLIAPKHILALMQYEKGVRYLQKINRHIPDIDKKFVVSPFMDDLGGVYGLPKEVEAIFAERLLQLAQDERPIAPRQGSSGRKALDVLATIFVGEDELEYTSPPREAILRKLMTQYSADRGIMPLAFDQFRAFVNQRSRIAPLTLFDETTPPLEIYLHAFRYASGNVDSEFRGADSDLYRLMWELCNLEKEEISAKGFEHLNLVSQSGFMHEVYKDTAMMGILAIKDMIGSLLVGDTQPLEAVVIKNIRILHEKLAAKAGTITQSPARFMLLTEYMQTQFQVVMDNLAHKPVQTYSQDERDFFSTLVRVVQEELIQRYHVSSGEWAIYQQQYADGLNPAVVPFTSYYPASEFSCARTITKPTAVAMETLHSIVYTSSSI